MGDQDQRKNQVRWAVAEGIPREDVNTRAWRLLPRIHQMLKLPEAEALILLVPSSSGQCELPPLPGKRFENISDPVYTQVKQLLELRANYGEAVIPDEAICDYIRANIVRIGLERAREARSSGRELTEHEQTRKLFIDKLDELANQDDIIKAKDEIIAEINAQSRAIQAQLNAQVSALQSNFARFLPHMRVFKTAFYFTCFFLASIFVDLVLGVKIVQPFWSALGAAISVSFVVMSYLMFLDWQKKASHDGQCH